MNKIALIIPHYANIADTLECIESIKKQSSYADIHIYLTYVLEPEFDVDAFLKQNPQLTRIKLSQNSGFGGSCNVALKKAVEDNCDIFITLNNDIFLEKNCIKNLVDYSKSFPEVGVISPKIYFYKGQEYHSNRYKENEKGKVIWYAGGILDSLNIYASHRGVDEVDQGQFDTTCETDFATGCCMVITKNALKKVGYFDEKYFLYYEDVDYSLRTKRAGFSVIYYPKACLWHKNASSSGKPGSKLHEYYQTRNRLYFGYKYTNARTKFALFRESLKMTKEGGIKQKAVKDYYLGKMGKTSSV